MMQFFPFYPDDWIKSERVRAMTLEQRGAFIELLAWMWQSDDCAVPDDERRVASQLGISTRKWRALRAQFMAADRPVLESVRGRLSNDSLLSHRRVALERIAKYSESGKLGAEKKKKRIENNGSDQATLKRRLSDPTSDALAIKNKNNNPPNGGKGARPRACVREATPKTDDPDALDMADRIRAAGEPQAVRFPEFYSAHPRPSKRDAARYHWLQHQLDAEADMILADLINRITNDEQWIEQGGRFIPGPLTYLERQLWRQPLVARPSRAEDRTAALIREFAND